MLVAVDDVQALAPEKCCQLTSSCLACASLANEQGGLSICNAPEQTAQLNLASPRVKRQLLVVQEQKLHGAK